MNLLFFFRGLSINQKLNIIMASQAQLAADLKAVTSKLTKIGAESTKTLQKVTELQAVIDAGAEVSAEVQSALDELKAQVQLVDDLVPDAPESTDEVTV